MIGRPKLLRVVLTICIFIAVSATVILYYRWYIRPQVSEKAIYATLQGIEVNNRDKVIATPKIIDSGRDGIVLGVRNSDRRFPYSWISLSKVSDGNLFMVPESQIITDGCDRLDEAVRGLRVNRHALRLIKLRCR
jgi:hypothetical protein